MQSKHNVFIITNFKSLFSVFLIFKLKFAASKQPHTCLLSVNDIERLSVNDNVIVNLFLAQIDLKRSNLVKWIFVLLNWLGFEIFCCDFS